MNWLRASILLYFYYAQQQQQQQQRGAVCQKKKAMFFTSWPTLLPSMLGKANCHIRQERRHLIGLKAHSGRAKKYFCD